MRGYLTRLAPNRFFVIVALSTVVVFVLAESFTTSRIAHAQGRVTSFTIRMENHAFTPGHEGGELIDVKTKARRSDGAYANIGHIFGKVGFLSGENSRQILLPTGELMTAYDSLHGVTRWNTNSPEERNRLKTMLFNMPTGCVREGEQGVGKETIMGQETVAVLWPSVANRKVTEWRALNLNCEPIQARIEERQPDGSYKVHNDISTVSLVLGEPDTALFDVPSDYVEMKPSEFLHKEAQKLGWPAEKLPELEQQAQREDAEYEKNH